MKNACLCLLGLFIFISFADAQKVKLKDLDVKAKFQRLPDVGFPNGVSTYFVDIDANSNALQAIGFTKNGLNKYIQLPGYEKITENVGAGIYISIDGPVGSTQKLEKTPKKSKDGKTWTEYNYSVTFSGSVKRKVVDQKGTVLGEEVEQYSEVRKSNTYTSTSELKKNYDSSKFYKANRESALRVMFDKTAKRLKWEYSYMPSEKKIELKRLKSKKHPKFKTFQKTEEITKKAFEAITVHDNTKFKELIAPALETWTSEEKELSGSDKQQKKLKFLCQLNACLTYMYSEDYDSALKYANMIVNGDEKTKKGKKLVKEITELKDKLTRLGLTERYFKIEVDESMAAEIEKVQENRKAAIAGGDIKEFPDFDDKLSVTRQSIVVPGTSVSISGHETEGYWVYNNTYFDGPDFREPKKIRFGYLKDGEISVGTPNFSKLSEVLIGGKRYYVDDVKVGSGLTAIKINNAVVETLYEFDRTEVVRIFPSFKVGRAYGQTNETEAAIVVYNKETEKYMPIRGLSSRKKSIQKIVKGCEVAVDLAAAEFKSEKGLLKKINSQNSDKIEQLVKVLESYDSCKK